MSGVLVERREAMEVVERRVSDFNAQNLANTAWAFAKVGQSDEKLFEAVAVAAAGRVSGVAVQNGGNGAWAVGAG